MYSNTYVTIFEEYKLLHIMTIIERFQNFEKGFVASGQGIFERPQAQIVFIQ